MKITFKFNPSSQLFRRLLYGISVALVVALIAALVSWLAVPSYLKNTLEQQVAEQTGRQLTVADVAFNPFTLTVDLSGVTLFDADKKTPDFYIDQLILKISPASLFRFAPVVREVVVKNPYLKLVRKQSDGKEENNFSDVVMRLAANPTKGEPLRYAISNIQLVGGAIHLHDHVVGKEAHIEAINFALPFVSNFSNAIDTFIEPGLSAKVNGSPFELKGRSKIFSDTRESTLTIDFNNLDLASLLAFSPEPLPFKVSSAKMTSRLSLNFFTQKDTPEITLLGTVHLHDVALTNFSDAPLLKARRISMKLQEANLMTQKIAMTTLLFDEPELWVGLNQQGALNWTNNERTPDAGNTSKPIVDLAYFELKNGTLHWSDAANATPTMTMQLSGINIDAHKISTNEKSPPGKLKIVVGDLQRQASFLGAIDLPHSTASGQITLSDFPLADYQPYFNRFLTAQVSGKLSLKTQLVVQNGQTNLKEFSGALEDLKLKAMPEKTKAGNGGSSDILAKKIAIENASLSSGSKQVKIDKIALDRVKGEVFRDADGAVSLIRLLKSVPVAKGKSSSDQSIKTKAPIWQTDINQIMVSDSNLVFGDKSKNPVVNIRADDVDAKLEQVSSNFKQPVKLMMSANLNATGKSAGRVAVEGVIAEKSAQLKVGLQNFSVVALQPYFTDLLNITLEKGALSLDGKLGWKAPKEISYQGVLKLENFASLDKGTSDSFLRWKMLEMSGIDADFGTKQQKITLGKIDINNFYARAILSEKGKLNLENIVVHQHADGQVPTEKGTEKNVGTEHGENVVKKAIAEVQNTAENPPPTIIKIGQINLNNGVINYTDNFIKPHFSMRMTGMKGTIGAFQSSVEQPAPVNLNGKIDNQAPIFISGSFNPLFSPMALDIKMTANGIDLPRLTTYSAKYAGYPITKGKLSLDVEYQLKDKKLTAKNSLKIDQLTFGEKVDSPDATDLPVLLAASLLADSNGTIKLDVPISGTIDDPEFTVTGIFFKVLMNMIGKVITSPFSLLAHSFSRSGELSYAEFASGSAILTDATKEKLNDMAKALAERPNLKLDIIGRADLEADAPGIRERRLSRQIRKMRAMQEDADADDRSISEADRAKAIGKIYAEAKFDKPSNMIGLPKSLPTAEMEMLIKENIPISEDDLRSLATRRASAVLAYLTETAGVAPERVYMIAPKISGGDIKDKGAVSRVDFDLKM